MSSISVLTGKKSGEYYKFNCIMTSCDVPDLEALSGYSNASLNEDEKEIGDEGLFVCFCCELSCF